jgi:hypothetical protein
VPAERRPIGELDTRGFIAVVIEEAEVDALRDL